jgi:HSP20 family protein
MTADVYETVDGDAYIVEVPVPGLDVNDISVEATPQHLTVSIRPEERNSQERRRYLQHEQDRAPTSRVFEFPTEIDPDTISAKLDAGMLRIHVPKAAASRRRVIPLQK